MATKSGTSSLTAKWKKIAEHEVLKRSSHSVAAVSDGGDGHELFVFGGELVARQPKDGHVHVLSTGMYSLLHSVIEILSTTLEQIS